MVSRSVCEACTATAVTQAAAALATQRCGRASDRTDRRPLLLACIDYAAAVVLSLADLSRPPAVRSSSVPTSLRPDPDAASRTAPHLGASTTTVWCHAGFLSHLLTLPLLSVVLASRSPAAASTRYSYTYWCFVEHGPLAVVDYITLRTKFTKRRCIRNRTGAPARC